MNLSRPSAANVTRGKVGLCVGSAFEATAVDPAAGGPPPDADADADAAGQDGNVHRKDAPGAFNQEWINAEDAQRAALMKIPKYQFMTMVIGFTGGSYTEVNFNRLAHPDVRKQIREDIRMRVKHRNDIASQKFDMFSKMLLETSNKQGLRMVPKTTADGKTVIAMEMSHAASSESSTQDDVQSVLQRLRHGAQPNMDLGDMLTDISKTVNSSIKEDPSWSWDNQQLTMSSYDWAMMPEHRGKFEFTPEFTSGIELVSAKLLTLAKVDLSDDEITQFGHMEYTTDVPPVLRLIADPEAARDRDMKATWTLLAQLVAFEIMSTVSLMGRNSTDTSETILRNDRTLLYAAVAKRLKGSIQLPHRPGRLYKRSRW